MNKKKKIRLIGKPLAKLNNDIHERDGHICIIHGCGRYVLPKAKFHHEPCGNSKEDRIERGCLLCDQHHTIRHHGREGLQEVKQECVEYLSSLYPEDWVDIRENIGRVRDMKYDSRKLSDIFQRSSRIKNI